MNISQAYPSRYLAADDLQGRAVTVTIETVTLQEIGQGHDKDTKLVLTFTGKQKALACNKTNAKTIEKLWGSETDNWIGKPIILAVREVEFQGNMVWAIRVSLQKPAAAGVQGAPAGTGRSDPPKPAHRPQAGPEGSEFPQDGQGDDDGSSVPF